MACLTSFKQLTGCEEALCILLSMSEPVSGTAAVDVEFADNRVLSRDVYAPRDFPHYDLCVKDGYAVLAMDTAGCSQSEPVTLRLVSGSSIRQGECLQVHSGSALPAGADAIAPVETLEACAGSVVIKEEARLREFIKPRGSVVRLGEAVFRQGRQLKPTDIAMLVSLGITKVEVYDKPRVLIIPTGDELVEPGKVPGPGYVNECNGLLCSMLVKRFGGKAAVTDIVPDRQDTIREALLSGLTYNLIITTGGTSVGARDQIEEAISAVGKVLLHGIRIKPGKPAGIGYIEGNGKKVPVIFLPGFPEACAANMIAFAEPVLSRIGRLPEPVHARETVELGEGTSGLPGTRSYVKINVDGRTATPVGILGRSTAKGRSGYAIISGDKTSYEARERIDAVYLE